MILTAWILLGIAVVGALMYMLAGALTVRQLATPPPSCPESELPPLTFLKPIKGAEEGLEENLRAFYEQDYPAPFELVFASTERDDPAMAVARAVSRDYPQVPTRFVLSDPEFGLNPKVSNLAGAIAAARYDLVLQTDANVWVPKDYVRRIVGELVARKAGILSSMVVGRGERSVGAALENMQLSAFISPSTVLVRDLVGITCTVGKSMLFRRSDLDALGGIEAVRDVLAEDFVIGEKFKKAGLGVVLSSTPVYNVNVDASVDRFVSRHTRWLKMWAVINVSGYLGALLANSFAFALLAFAFSGFDWRFGLAAVGFALFKIGIDSFLLPRTRGEPLALRHALLSPLKDIVNVAIWPYAGISRSVEWRGVRLRIGRGSFLRHDEGNLPVRIARSTWRTLRPSG